MINQTTLRKKDYKEVIQSNSIELNENEFKSILSFDVILEYMFDENLLNIEEFSKDKLFNILKDKFLDTYSYISSTGKFIDIY